MIGISIAIPGQTAAHSAEWVPTALPGAVLWLRADLGITLNDIVLTSPNDWTNAAWSKSNASATFNAGTDPIGGNNASSLIEDGTLNLHYALNTFTGWVTGLPTTLSVYAKAGSRSWLYLAGNGINDGSYFDLTNGVVGSTSGTITSKSIASAGNGWYKCTITLVTTAANLWTRLATGDAVGSYAGNGTGNVLLYGAAATQPKVSAWADQSGSGNNATQGTAANQPLLQPGIINGQTAMDFDGSNDSLVLGTNIAGAAMTVFIVAAQLSTSAAYRAIFNTQKLSVYARPPGADIWEAFQGADCPSTVQLTPTPAVLEVAKRAFNDIDLAHNGSQVTSAAGAADSANAASSIGCNSAVQFANLRMREIIVYSRVLTALERSRVRKYLGSTNGIVVS